MIRKGRLPDVNIIKKEIKKILEFKDQLKDKNIIVTLGAISAKIDEVRVLTNLSSGKMGLALAQKCLYIYIEEQK